MCYIFWVLLVSLGIQHAIRRLHIVICGLPRAQFFFWGGVKLRNTKYVFWFSLQLLSETFLILRRNERDMIKKCILIFLWSTLHSCSISVRIFWPNFEKSSNIEFLENPSSGSRIVPCGRTDMMLIVAFRHFANKPKHCSPNYQVVVTCKLIRYACVATV